MKKLRWGEHVSRGFSQGSQGISFPILILVSLVCYGNLITDNGKVTLRSTWVSSRVSRDACKTSEIKKVMLLQANIDLGLESTIACAKLLSNPNQQSKSKEPLFIFLVLAHISPFLKAHISPSSGVHISPNILDSGVHISSNISRFLSSGYHISSNFYIDLHDLT